jgi:hypothetical protein
MPSEASIAALEPMSRVMPQLASANAVAAGPDDFATALARAARDLDPNQRRLPPVRTQPAASPTPTASPTGTQTALLPTATDGAAAGGAATDGVAAKPARLTNWRDLEPRERSNLFAHGQLDPASKQASDFFGADGFGFDDLVDIVNPLQHIPLLSALYRWATGDKISQGASLVGDVMFGGALFAGPMALIGPTMNAALTEAMGGQQASDRVVTAVLGPSQADETPINLAEKMPSSPLADEPRAEAVEPNPAAIVPPATGGEPTAEATAPAPLGADFAQRLDDGLAKYRAFALDKPKAFPLRPLSGTGTGIGLDGAL